MQEPASTDIARSINQMDQSSLSSSNQTKKSIKGLRLGIWAVLATLLVVVGYLVWPKPGQRDSNAESIVRTVPVSSPSSGAAVSSAQYTSVPGNTQSSPRPVAVDSQGMARAIQARGQAIQEENRKIRDSLAAGDLSALPDSLKVADLPLDTPPPEPVPSPSTR